MSSITGPGNNIVLLRYITREDDYSIFPESSLLVHFAPLEKGWEINLLKPFFRAILSFERAFEALFPAQRRGNEYAKSLLADNERLTRKILRQMFQALN